VEGRDLVLLHHFPSVFGLPGRAIGEQQMLETQPEKYRGRNKPAEDLTYQVVIPRNESETWLTSIRSGNGNKAHSLAKLENHHFKYPDHRISGQVHVRHFRTGVFSSGSGSVPADGSLVAERERPSFKQLSAPKQPEQLIDIQSLS
jgi:hypothetical protein